MIYWISVLKASLSTHPALYAVSVRAVGISPRTSFPTVRCLPAVDSEPPHGSSPFGRVPNGTRLARLQAISGLALQVSDSASSRFLRDFHPSSHIASVVLKSGSYYCEYEPLQGCGGILPVPAACFSSKFPRRGVCSAAGAPLSRGAPTQSCVRIPVNSNYTKKHHPRGVMLFV